MQEITEAFIVQNWNIVREVEKELQEANRLVEFHKKEVERLTHIESSARSYAIWLQFRQKQAENENAKTK